jgi:formylglycine-generating enzyme required for sulfatase activity
MKSSLLSYLVAPVLACLALGGFTAAWAADKAGNVSLLRDCPDCPEMVVIPAGSFEMGSNDEFDEKPLHRVSLKSFALGRTEVTQAQWKAVMGANPSSFTKCGDNCPVDNVSWDDAQIFVQKLSTKTGKKYRLPTEAEWEYACRAGERMEYCGSDKVDSVSWYDEKKGFKTTYPVATKQANAFGLYDMSGNVWEWVEDGYHESYVGAPADGSEWKGYGATRVLRGGSWLNLAERSRAAHREWYDPSNRDSNYGFRVVRVLP